MRGYDWARTPLGPMTDWSVRLQTAVSTCLSTGFPMVVNWGKELVQIYNDAAIGVYGDKHPQAMGQPAQTNFPEFWEFSAVEAIVKHIRECATPFRAEDERLYLNRNGLLQETYFTFSLSPMLDDSGAVLGILNTYVETTSRVLGERRMTTLRNLSERAVRARTVAEACSEALAALATNPYDLRFVMLYLAERECASATLAGSTGIASGSPAAPHTIDLRSPAPGGFSWPLGPVLRTREAVRVEDLAAKVDLGPRAGRTTPPRDALVLPLARSSDAAPAGALVVGLSPRLPFDDAYRGFLQLVAAGTAAAIASAEAYEEASQRAERLAEIDRAKSVFYSNISHEFRTPLTLLLGPVEDMLRDERGNLTSAQREQLTALRRNALRLLRLVSGLLDLARVESGRMVLLAEPTDLSSLTREVASSFESAMASAGLRFVVECPPLPRSVRIDRGVWETIVLNLLSNALKYTRAGSVTLKLEKVGDRVRLVVRDTGVGIPESALPHVFERFYRARESRARSIEGTGLGLALVREFVRALGGEVSVASEAGRGSTFTVEVPCEGAPQPAPAPDGERAPSEAERASAERTRASAFLQEAQSWVDRGERPSTGPPPPAGARGAARPRIVVAEDNPDMRQYLVHLLAREYEVQAAADGVAALELAFRSPPDLVLSDVLMPGLDGIALVRALRAEPRTRALPVVLLTARAGEDAALDALGSGADDYVVKPFSSRELRARLHTHLELARARREAAESAMKDTFIGVVSHELRTPLTTLKLHLELLEREAVRSIPVSSARFDPIRRGIARMESLVGELLSLSAIKTGTLTLNRERGDLTSTCKQAAEEQTLIGHREILVDLPSEPTFAYVDPQRIQQVVSNLLSNAMKYSPPERPVALRLRHTDDEAIISVEDEGPGIPAEAIPHLFERFYRVPGIEVRAGSQTGLGLGLFLSQTIVERHGGSIDVESEPGRGSTFSIHLPLAGASPQAVAP